MPAYYDDYGNLLDGLTTTDSGATPTADPTATPTTATAPAADPNAVQMYDDFGNPVSPDASGQNPATPQAGDTTSAATPATDWSAIGKGVQGLISNPTLQNLLSYNLAKNAGDKAGALADSLRSTAVDSLSQLAAAIGSKATPDLLQYVKQMQADVQSGKVQPAQAIAAVQQQTALKGIAVPDNIKAAQNQVLSQLQTASTQGYTPIERAAIQKALNQITTQTRGEDQAIATNFQERGQYGAGNELVNRLINQQQGANQAAQQGLDIESQAQQRAFNALTAEGQLAQQQGQQSLDTQANVGSAQDAINKLNATLASQTSEANAARQQQAQGTNLQATMTADQAATAAAQAQQDQSLAQQTLEANTLGNAAKNATSLQNAPYLAQQNAQAAKNQVVGNAVSSNGGSSGGGGIISDIGNAVSTVGKVAGAAQGIGSLISLFSDPKMKEEKRTMTDEELDNIFSQLVPSSFKYTKEAKEAGAPEGQMAGIMADALQKTPAKGMVVEVDVAGKPRKAIDGQKALSLALAALTSHSKRIQDLEDK